jgi:beta-barrel assembly-enhancing protease
MPAYLKFPLATVVLFLVTFAFASAQPSTWTPPPSRNAKTPFAPKPFAGDNIFKGEGELWLADAVEKHSSLFEPIDEKAIVEYVTQVGNNLAAYSVAPKKQYRFIVTDEWRPDAMTAGGGRIYITQGMLLRLESEDELAALLAHEIAHDAFSHPAKTVTRQMFWLTGTRKVKTPVAVEAALLKLFSEYEKKPLANITETVLGFSRFDELEADRAAFYNTYKAGYNPHALTTILKRLAREDENDLGTSEYRKQQVLLLLFGTHPPTAQRSLALSWESNFVKMPARNSHFASNALTDMKSRITALWEHD